MKRGGREAAEKLVAEGIDARSVRLDVTDSESIAAAARRIGQEFGGRLDVLVNNAADPGYTATDLNGHSGPRTVEEGARIAVHLATLPSDGTTGGFFKLKLSGAIFRNIAMGESRRSAGCRTRRCHGWSGFPQLVKQGRARVNLHLIFLSIHSQRDWNCSSRLA
jgi:Enoyl-(Acyl carrier protein) reductase